MKVAIEVNDDDLYWVAEDNCLLSYELERLRDWVSNIYESNENEIRFTENELAFFFNKDSSILTVVLDFYLHPKGENYEYGEDGDDEYLLSFRMNERKLKAFLADIERWLSLFPIRNLEIRLKNIKKSHYRLG